MRAVNCPVSAPTVRSKGHVDHEVGKAHLHRFGDANQHLDSEIGGASFDPAIIAALDAGPACHVLLAHLPLLAQAPYPCTDQLESVFPHKASGWGKDAKTSMQKLTSLVVRLGPSPYARPNQQAATGKDPR